MEEFAVSKDFPNLVEPVPEVYQQNVIDLVTNLLQPVNDATGWKNLITSGYRPNKLNKAVGGSLTSDHRFGRASDNNFYKEENGKIVYISSYDVANTVLKLKLKFDQMILYPDFVHLSYRKNKNRNQVLYSKNYKGKRI
jgi:hypothetical protein